MDAGKEWGGGQKQTLLLMRELIKRGYPAKLIVQPDSPIHQKASGASIPVWSLRMRGEMDIIAFLKLARKMKRDRCLLVHFHDAHSLALGSAAASWMKVPLRVISRKVAFPLKTNPLSHLKYTRDIDAVIAVSQEVKRVLAGGGIDPEKIRVIPDGVDYSSFENASSGGYLRKELSFAPDDFLVGIVAHLADHKGHRYLIEATRVLKARVPKVKVIVVGAGPLRMGLGRQARESRVEEMVFFLGFRDDIPQILASLDLFVLSSTQEGMGSSILEAMASRLPVVASKAGGIPELVGHEETGLLVPPRDPKALAEAIIRIYSDKELGRRLGQKGYELVHRKFSARAMASKVIDAYEQIAQKKDVKLLT